MLINGYFKSLIWKINFWWKLSWNFVKIYIHSKSNFTFLNKPCVIIADSSFQTLLDACNCYFIYWIQMFLSYLKERVHNVTKWLLYISYEKNKFMMKVFMKLCQNWHATCVFLNVQKRRLLQRWMQQLDSLVFLLNRMHLN